MNHGKLIGNKINSLLLYFICFTIILYLLYYPFLISYIVNGSTTCDMFKQTLRKSICVCRAQHAAVNCYYLLRRGFGASAPKPRRSAPFPNQ